MSGNAAPMHGHEHMDTNACWCINICKGLVRLWNEGKTASIFCLSLLSPNCNVIHVDAYAQASSCDQVLEQGKTFSVKLQYFVLRSFIMALNIFAAVIKMNINLCWCIYTCTRLTTCGQILEHRKNTFHSIFCFRSFITLLNIFVVDILNSISKRLRGHNLVHFAVYSYHEFKLRYLKNHKLFSIRVKELFEPIVLRKKKAMGFCPF